MEEDPIRDVCTANDSETGNLIYILSSYTKMWMGMFMQGLHSDNFRIVLLLISGQPTFSLRAGCGRWSPPKLRNDGEKFGGLSRMHAGASLLKFHHPV